MGTCGEGNWSQIAWQFAGRIGKQCRERWHNQLRPNIKRDAWTNEEEEHLIAAHRGLGNRCVMFSQLFSQLSQPRSSRGAAPGWRPERFLLGGVEVIKRCHSQSRVGTRASRTFGCVPLWPSMCGSSGMPSQTWSQGHYCWPASAQHSPAPFVSPHVAQVGLRHLFPAGGRTLPSTYPGGQKTL